jgi:hypothetical protein
MDNRETKILHFLGPTRAMIFNCLRKNEILLLMIPIKLFMRQTMWFEHTYQFNSLYFDVLKDLQGSMD